MYVCSITTRVINKSFPIFSTFSSDLPCRNHNKQRYRGKWNILFIREVSKTKILHLLVRCKDNVITE